MKQAIKPNAAIPNTFGLDVHASWLATPTSLDALFALQQHPAWLDHQRLIIGEGSNILFTQPFDGMVIQPCLMGYRYQPLDDQHIALHLGAGNNWHQVVMQSLQDGYHGLENLVAIPGTVGATPVQNIGAYGREIKDFLISVQAVNLDTMESKSFSKQDCNFTYRSSIFKQQAQPWLITDVCLRLYRLPQHSIHHTNVQKAIDEKGLKNPTSLDIAHCIHAIRNQKLPNPQTLGNAGSFFKNPIINIAHFEALRQAVPEIPAYPLQPADQIKVPAAWLIEQIGKKGNRSHNTGTHIHHALVLVNHGDAKGSEIWAFAQSIQEDVYQRFGIALEPEVNII